MITLSSQPEKEAANKIGSNFKKNLQPYFCKDNYIDIQQTVFLWSDFFICIKHVEEKAHAPKTIRAHYMRRWEPQPKVEA